MYGNTFIFTVVVISIFSQTTINVHNVIFIAVEHIGKL